MQKSTIHLVLGCVLVGVAAFTVLHPVLTLGACVAVILLLVALHPGEPLRPARMGLLAIAILIPLAGPGSYLATRLDNANLTATKLIAFLALGHLIWVKATSGEPFAFARQNNLILWFAGVILLSFAVNEKSPVSLDMLWGYATVMLTFLLAVNTLQQQRHVALLLVVVMTGYCISIGMGARGLSLNFETDMMRQFANPDRLRGASAGSAVTFGMGTAICFLLAIYHAVTGRDKWQRGLAILAAPVFLYGTVASYARSVYLATLAGLLLMAFLLRSRLRLAPLVTGAILVLLLVAPLLDWAAFLSRMLQIASNPAVDHSYSQRMSYHVLGAKLWLKSPIIGIGPGWFLTRFGNEEFRFFADTFSNSARSLHNMYLSTLCHTGIAGLTVLCMIIGTCFQDLCHVRRNALPDNQPMADTAGMVMVALAAVLVAAAFNPTDDFKLIWILFGMAAALRGIQDREHRERLNECRTP